MDVLVKRKDGGFITNVYRKEYCTGLYTDWFSLTDKRYKLNVIKCLLERAWKICSNNDLFHKEIIKIKIILNKNNYPKAIIDKQINNFLNSKYIKSKQQQRNYLFYFTVYRSNYMQ